MTVLRLHVSNAPDPAGAYSHGVIANGFLFTAGMGPIDPETGQIVGDDVEEQTRQVLRNLGAILADAGLDYSDVVKATAHLSDVAADFAAYNRAYGEFFPDGPPARTTVGSTLPNILVEIDFVAALR